MENLSPKNCILGHGNTTELSLNSLKMLKCTTCGLVWRKSFILGEAHYENKQTNLSDGKIESRTSNSLSRLALIKNYLNESSVVCDVGCGEGVFLRVLKDANYNAYGIDPLRTKYAEQNNLEVINLRIEDFELKRGTNFISLFHVIEHLPRPKETLKKIYDLMPEGAMLMIETPRLSAPAIVGSNFVHPLIYDEHFFYFDEGNLKELVQSLGFKVLKSGRRSFDQYNAPIKISLLRLGFNNNFFKKVSKNNNKSEGSKNRTQKQSTLRTLTRRGLAWLVVVLGRGDYQWLILKK